MPWYIGKARGKMCVWSTIVDAPVSCFRESFEELARDVGRYRASTLGELYQVDEAYMAGFNRAGEHEESLTMDELLDQYTP